MLQQQPNQEPQQKLQAGILSENPSMVRAALNAGADVNTLLTTGEWPLVAAARLKSTGIVAVLIDSGCISTQHWHDAKQYARLHCDAATNASLDRPAPECVTPK
jgi:hypothetical protein